MARKPTPKYKHLTAFAQKVKPRTTSLEAFILCGRRLMIGVDYTNNPDGDSNCPDCARKMEYWIKSGNLTRGTNPMLRTSQVLYYR